MFNKKIKQELAEYKKVFQERGVEIIELNKQIKNLEDFNKRIDSKIEEICKPKIDNFCLAMAGSGLTVSRADFDTKINILNKSCKSLEELLISQAKDLQYLKEREEDNKKLLFLAAKVEQLINNFNIK